jgi:hypothetical protein
MDARCGEANDKVLVCHYGQMICIGTGDVQMHLGHGCTIATCSNTSAAKLASTGKGDQAKKGTSSFSATRLNISPNPVASQARNWLMPSVYDFSQASPTGIAEIEKLNTGVRAGKYDGKYEYTAPFWNKRLGGGHPAQQRPKPMAAGRQKIPLLGDDQCRWQHYGCFRLWHSPLPGAVR